MIGAFYHVWKWQCSTSEIGDAPLYNPCSLLIQVITTEPLAAPSKCKSRRFNAWEHSSTHRMTLRTTMVMVFGVVSSEGHIISLKSAWKSTPKCTWMCWRVWWSPDAIRWPVADPGCSSRTQRRSTSLKRPRLGFRRSATTLYPSLTGPHLPRPEPAGLLHLVIRREHHQHDLPQHQSQPDRRHLLSIHKAPAGAYKQGMLAVPDLYWGGDWSWRQLHWIDVSSTT